MGIKRPLASGYPIKPMNRKPYSSIVVDNPLTDFHVVFSTVPTGMTSFKY